MWETDMWVWTHVTITWPLNNQFMVSRNLSVDSREITRNHEKSRDSNAFEKDRISLPTEILADQTRKPKLRCWICFHFVNPPFSVWLSLSLSEHHNTDQHTLTRITNTCFPITDTAFIWRKQLQTFNQSQIIELFKMSLKYHTWKSFWQKVKKFLLNCSLKDFNQNQI